MRDASIHIKKSIFKEIIKDMDIEFDVDRLFYLASKYAINNRLVVTKEIKEKVEKYNTTNADKFNLLLLMARQELKHTCGIILKNDSAYNTLKSVTTLAEQYCQMFNLPLDEGFKEYINLGMNFIKKNYALNKFLYYNQKIIASKQSKVEINQDSNKWITDELIGVYEELGNTTVDKPFRVHFVRTAELLKEMNVTDVRGFLQAQFDFFKIFSTIPEPNHLYSEEAKLRYKEPTKELTERDILLQRIANKNANKSL